MAQGGLVSVWSTILDVMGLAASMATAAGVFFAMKQLKEAKEQATTSFEDGLAREYRELAHQMPVAALLGDAMDEETLKAHLGEFYRYVDLSNEQAFLWRQGRIRPETWRNWEEGIRTTLARPAFRAAWETIKTKAPDSFDELRRIDGSGRQG
jgi:hypothetical protein